jgi:hypothetical protein
MTKIFVLARVAVAGALFGAVAACGPMTEGFDKGFNESWAKSTKEGCLKTASQSAGAALAEQYCSCMVTELSSLSTKEKMEMQPTSPAVTTALNKCSAQLQQ